MRAVSILLMLMPSLAWALEARLQILARNKGNLSLKGVEIPKQQLSKQLKSGLHSTLQFQVAGANASGLMFRRARTWKVYYDLWDDAFRVTAQDDGGAETKLEFKSLEALMEALENPSFQGLQTKAESKSFLSEGAMVELNILLNPVSQETVERMKKWANQRRVPGTSDAIAMAGKGEPQEVGPRFPGLFNEILGHEISAASESATWSYRGSAKLTVTEGAQ